MELFVAPESTPFTIAIIFVFFLGMLEAVTLLIGVSLSGFFDHLLAIHFHGDTDSGLGWLHLGKVPLLVLLVLFLTTFAIIGFACNALVYNLIGKYPPSLLSSILAFLCALPIVRVCGTTLARIIPTDESSAVSLETLVGNVAIVVNGTASVNYPAEARVKNAKGQTFYVRVEPESESEQFIANQSVLLVKQISGTRFLAIANPRPDLL